MTDSISASAGNLAEWHESQLRALDLSCRRSPALWWCEARTPLIYHRAITLSDPSHSTEQRHRLEELVEACPEGTLSIRDSWGALDLEDLGFHRYTEGTWMSRAPGALAGEVPSELSLEEVGTVKALREFEVVSVEAFETPQSHVPGPFGFHAPAVLDDLRLGILAGRVGGRMVSVAMTYQAMGALGIYGVATLPGHRRRGYGSALTRAAIARAPDLPAVLQPSDQAIELYAGFGFESVGSYVVWEKRREEQT